MGGDAEKLLTLEEAAKRLALSPDDLEGLIRSGRIPSFRLGGSLLRLRLKDVEALRSSGPKPAQKLRPQRAMARPSGRPLWAEKFFDFFYFNDFYLIALLLLAVLLVIILSL